MPRYLESLLQSQEYYFLILRGKNYKHLQSSYSKDSSQLTYISQLVILYARAARAILNHTSIKKYKQYFFSVGYTQYLYDYFQLETYQYIFMNCSWFAYSSLIDLFPSIEEFVDFLKKDPSAFAFASQKKPLSSYKSS